MRRTVVVSKAASRSQAKGSGRSKSRNISPAEREARRLQSERDKATNAMVRIAGDGGYKEWLSANVPKGTFAKAGGAAGGALGGFLGDRLGLGGPGRALGKFAGGALGDLMSHITGFGDYQVKVNSLLNGGAEVPEGMPVPQFVDKGHCVTVCHREFIGNVYVPSNPADFVLTSYRVNPANSGLFVFLSQLGWNYQQWAPRGMVFVFKSMSSSTVTAGGPLGTVAMAMNYNAGLPEFADMREMLNSEYATATKPSSSIVHAIECDPALSSYPVRYIGDAEEASSDPQMYDWGLFQIATSGLPGTAGDILGELWVSYEIDLFKPRIAPYPLNNGVLTTTSGVAADAILGTGDPDFEEGVIQRENSNHLKFLAPGNYMLVQYYDFSVSYTGAITVASSDTSKITVNDSLAFTVNSVPFSTRISYVSVVSPATVSITSTFTNDPVQSTLFAFSFPGVWYNGLA
jgi:hypothetical protein